jgi:hypothetical protein
MTGLTDRLRETGDRTIVLRAADGSPVFELQALHGLAAAVLAVMTAPRLTAAAALGGMLRGMSITIEEPEPEAAA